MIRESTMHEAAALPLERLLAAALLALAALPAAGWLVWFLVTRLAGG